MPPQTRATRREWLQPIVATAMAAGLCGCTPKTSGPGQERVRWVEGQDPVAPQVLLSALPASLAGFAIGYQTGRYHHHPGGRVLATAALRVYRRGLDRVRIHWLDHLHLPAPWDFDPAFARLGSQKSRALRLATGPHAADLHYSPEQRSGVLLADIAHRFALRIEGDAASASELAAWLQALQIDPQDPLAWFQARQ